MRKRKTKQPKPYSDEIKEPEMLYETKQDKESCYPCNYSVEEMRLRALRAVKEAKDGKIISQDEMRKRHSL